MFSTDEHGLTQPTAQQEQDWTEANDSPPESTEPDGPEPTDPAPSESPAPAPAEPPEDLPF